MPSIIQYQQNYPQNPIMLYSRAKVRGSSATKLPPINNNSHKYTNLVESAKNKIKGLDVSLQLVSQFSKPKIDRKATSRKKNSGQANRIVSLRLRTDSVGGMSNKKSQQKDWKRSSPEVQSTEDKNFESSLQDFHKHVKINKQYIQRQIKRRNVVNKKQKKQNSCKIIKHNEQNEPQYKRKLLTEQSKIFQQIQQIISSKVHNSASKQKEQGCSQKLDLNQVRNALKLARITKNIRNLSPEKDKFVRKSRQSETSNSSRIVLKDQNNYHEWRRVDLSPHEKSPKYKISNFEIQNQRLKQFVLKNEVSLCQYFEYKKQLYQCQSNKTKTPVY